MGSTFEAKFGTKLEGNLLAQFIAFGPVVFQVAKCLRDFNILKAIKDSKDGLTFDQIVSQTGISSYGLGVLADGGESAGILVLKGERYFLTIAGEYLADDPLTQVNMNFTHDVCYQGLFDLKESIQNGKPEGLKHFGNWETIYSGLSELPPPVLKSWLEFDHFFSDDAFPRALRILFESSPKSILDVGGNTGKFALLCAQSHPEVIVTILDHPKQLEMAEKNAIKAGVRERVRGHGIDLLDHSIPFPKGHDIVWMSQFLDCFSPKDILGLMRRAHDSMGEDSRYFIMEPFTDNQVHEASRFCLNMTSPYFTALANGNSRMYPSKVFRDLLDEAGFEIEEEFRVRTSQTIFKCRKT
jgi:ubiquinone/menaquinone biosynthesis C-methylase UbiE